LLVDCGLVAATGPRLGVGFSAQASRILVTLAICMSGRCQRLPAFIGLYDRRPAGGAQGFRILMNASSWNCFLRLVIAASCGGVSHDARSHEFIFDRKSAGRVTDTGESHVDCRVKWSGACFMAYDRQLAKGYSQFESQGGGIWGI